MAGPVLEVRDVSLNFGDLWALRDVSIDVPEKRTIGLIGPNGAGKSTLLNVIAGRQAPSAGRIGFRGGDVTRSRAVARARHGIRRTFQDLALFHEMSVLDNLLVAGDTARGGGARRAGVATLVESLGLGPWLYREVQTLPHPVQRLVSYARAVAGEPTLLLLDEPAAGLSESARALLAARLREDIAARGLSVVLVEHDMGFIRELCDEAYVLNAGRVIAFGSFAEIAASSTVRAAYLGDSEDGEE
ncbi:MAG TPA: ATP-binding cassette domain-containing protein [Amycolatopsis sp.]|nr:ATP-binding cassette domain-containing protein [Amycolatopsis sp.]